MYRNPPPSGPCQGFRPMLIPVDALSHLLIWASTEAWIVIIVGCVPPCRPLMERALQILGLASSKKSSGPYPSGSHGPYAQFGTGRSKTQHSNMMPDSQGITPFDQSKGLTWVELTTGGRNSSKERIVPGNDVIVTTDIRTRFEDAKY